MINPDHWRDIELRSLDIRATNLRRDLWQQQRDGIYKGFSVFTESFLELLSAGEQSGQPLINRRVYSLTFPKQNPTFGTVDQWRENKAFEELADEFRVLSGVNTLVAVEHLWRCWSILRVSTDQKDVFPRELIRFAMSPDYFWGRNFRYHANWTFFENHGDEFDSIASKVSPLGAKGLAYQESALLGLLQLVYRFGKRDAKALSLESILALHSV